MFITVVVISAILSILSLLLPSKRWTAHLLETHPEVLPEHIFIDRYLVLEEVIKEYKNVKYIKSYLNSLQFFTKYFRKVQKIVSEFRLNLIFLKMQPTGNNFKLNLNFFYHTFLVENDLLFVNFVIRVNVKIPRWLLYGIVAILSII